MPLSAKAQLARIKRALESATKAMAELLPLVESQPQPARTEAPQPVPLGGIMTTVAVFGSETSLEMRVMRALHRRVAPLPANVLAYLGKLKEPISEIEQALESLRSTCYVKSGGLPGMDIKWYLTPAGRSLMDQHCKVHPVAGDEMPAQDNCASLPAESHDAHLPSIATCCIGEDLLDKWWQSLDVELKADAFLTWALECPAADAAPGDVRIPVTRMSGAVDDVLFGQVAR